MFVEPASVSPRHTSASGRSSGTVNTSQASSAASPKAVASCGCSLYNPIFDGRGKPFKVVKYCTEVTEQKMRAADFEGQIKAIDKSQAVIEFELNGVIRNANENFLRTVATPSTRSGAATTPDVRGRRAGGVGRLSGVLGKARTG